MKRLKIELLYKHSLRLKQDNTYPLNFTYLFNAYSTEKSGMSQLNM